MVKIINDEPTDNSIWAKIAAGAIAGWVAFKAFPIWEPIVNLFKKKEEESDMDTRAWFVLWGRRQNVEFTDVHLDYIMGESDDTFVVCLERAEMLVKIKRGKTNESD